MSVEQDFMKLCRLAAHGELHHLSPLRCYLSRCVSLSAYHVPVMFPFEVIGQTFELLGEWKEGARVLGRFVGIDHVLTSNLSVSRLRRGLFNILSWNGVVRCSPQRPQLEAAPAR